MTKIKDNAPMQNFRDTFQYIRTFPSAFWIVISATLINQIGNMAVVFMVLYLNESLGYSLTIASSAFATFSASMIISGLFGGSIIDKFGAPRMMILTLMANSASLLTIPFVHTLLPIFLLCITWGMTFGIFRPASQTFVSQLSNPGMFKITFSLYRLVLNLGMSIGPALGGFLAHFSYHYIFYVNGTVNLIAAMILLIGLYNTEWLKRKITQSRSIGINLACVIHDKSLRIFLLGLIPVAMIFFQHQSTLAVFIRQDLHFPIGFYGLLFSINTLIIVFTELPLNIATINWPYRTNFMLGSLFTAVGFAGMYFATTHAHVIFLTVLWTIGEMILFPSASSYIADIAPPEQRGTYISLNSTCSNIGMLFGPWSGALIMDHAGPGLLWIGCGFLGLLAMSAFYSLREPNVLVSEGMS